MKDNERILIDKLIGEGITDQQFLKEFPVDILSNLDYFKNLLEVAYDEKNERDIDYLFYIGYTFNLFKEKDVDYLCKLVKEPWHHQHEDIATLFDFLKSPNSIECLYKTTLTEFEYLSYDDSYALAVKCIWALGNINTEESKQKLELLSKSENEIIRQNAIKQLERNN